jgi:hypothetical protein
MDDAVVVRRFERLGDLSREGPSLGQRERASGKTLR